MSFGRLLRFHHVEMVKRHVIGYSQLQPQLQLSNNLSKVWRVHVWQNYNEKKFSRPTFHRSNSVTQEVAKLWTRDFTT